MRLGILWIETRRIRITPALNLQKKRINLKSIQTIIAQNENVDTHENLLQRHPSALNHVVLSWLLSLAKLHTAGTWTTLKVLQRQHKGKLYTHFIFKKVAMLLSRISFQQSCKYMFSKKKLVQNHGIFLALISSWSDAKIYSDEWQ